MYQIKGWLRKKGIEMSEFHDTMKCSKHGAVLKEQVMGRMVGDPCPLSLFETCDGVMVRIDSSESREYTQEEIRKKFLKHLSMMVDYWADIPSKDPCLPDLPEKTTRDRLEGLAFSFLTMLDGSSMNLPAMEIVLTPHPEDKAYAKEVGDNWYPQPAEKFEDCITVHGGSMLHEMWNDFRKKYGKQDK